VFALPLLPLLLDASHKRFMLLPGEYHGGRVFLWRFLADPGLHSQVFELFLDEGFLSLHLQGLLLFLLDDRLNQQQFDVCLLLAYLQSSLTQLNLHALQDVPRIVGGQHLIGHTGFGNALEVVADFSPIE
jgi:hypothetical protein